MSIDEITLALHGFLLSSLSHLMLHCMVNPVGVLSSTWVTPLHVPARQPLRRRIPLVVYKDSKPTLELSQSRLLLYLVTSGIKTRVTGFSMPRFLLTTTTLTSSPRRGAGEPQMKGGHEQEREDGQERDLQGEEEPHNYTTSTVLSYSQCCPVLVLTYHA